MIFLILQANMRKKYAYLHICCIEEKAVRKIKTGVCIDNGIKVWYFIGKDTDNVFVNILQTVGILEENRQFRKGLKASTNKRSGSVANMEGCPFLTAVILLCH